MGNFLRETLPYILQGLLGLIALVALIKDWKDYGEASGKYKHPVRIAVLIGTIAVIFFSMIDTYNTRIEAKQKEQEASRKEAANKKQAEDLTGQIRLEREENKHNSDGFRESFGRLYQKYSDLAAKTQNAELLREIKETRDELKTTQEKLTQPKAELVASFWKSEMTEADVEKQIDATRNKDGSVSLDIVTLNAGDVVALRGAILLRVCMLCKFTKEPEGSQHLPGASEQERTFPFEHILSHTLTEKRTIEVTPLPAVGNFTFAVGYACENCVTEMQILHVKLVPQLRFPR
jgi:hypothetical protein